MKKFVCSVCGYVHEGKEVPDKCPLCQAPASKFSLQPDDLEIVNGHKIGVAKDANSEILEGLRDNFKAECIEVGMYIAMSRQADREGYTEVSEAYKRIACEEADHASRFAELLGDVLESSTKKNLQLRVQAEVLANQDKKKIATRAKELNLDAIHDTVHEMCKDEARHALAFKGLLDRYFS